jgi:hypothetical protein
LSPILGRLQQAAGQRTDSHNIHRMNELRVSSVLQHVAANGSNVAGTHAPEHALNLLGAPSTLQAFVPFTRGGHLVFEVLLWSCCLLAALLPEYLYLPTELHESKLPPFTKQCLPSRLSKSGQMSFKELRIQARSRWASATRSSSIGVSRSSGISAPRKVYVQF